MPRYRRKLPSRFNNWERPSIEGLEGRRLLNAADLDASFSEDGQYLSADAVWDYVGAVKRQGDGKLVVAGTLVTASPSDYAFYIQRFHADGTPDDTFGSAGRVTTEFSTGTDVATDLLIQPDGMIVAVGVTDPNPVTRDSSFALARYNADGSLDAEFGEGGLVRTNLNTARDGVFGGALQSDGKIVVAGISSGATGPDEFTVARYLPDGTLDPAFGTGGIVRTSFGGFGSEAAAVAIDSDGRIVVGGTHRFAGVTTASDYAVARYNRDGSPDATFDGDGKVVVNFESRADRGRALALQEDGKILVAGDASGTNTLAHFGAARLNEDGSLDPTWAGDGTLRLPLDAQQSASGATAVHVQSDGRVVLAGQHGSAAGPTSIDFAVARLTETGELDPTFGDGGVRLLDFGGGMRDVGADAVLLPGERILVVGTSQDGPQFRTPETAMAQFTGGVDFATLRLGTLSVVGTAGDDVIEIATSGQDYVVTRNGATNTISPATQPAGAATLNVLTIGGNDTVNVVDLVRPGTISLGSGNDTVTLSGAGVGTQPLTIDGAQGADTLNVPASLVVPVTFGGGLNPDGPNVVNFTGSDGDDTIEVNNASVAGAGTSVGFSNIHSVNLSARGGNDVINWANDRAAALDLGDGNDTINFNRGSFFAIVTVSGGAGDDVVVATTGGGGANVTFDPGAGSDKVIYEGRDFIDTIGFSPTEVAGIPIVRFAGLETLIVKGNGDDDDISGTVSPDGPNVEINGGVGNDGITVTFEAGARATVNGGDGADTLNLAATAGDDTLRLEEASVGLNGESVPYTNIEKVSLNGAGGSDTIVYDGSLNLPTLDVAGGGPFGARDVLRLTGGDGADAFTLVHNGRVTHGAKIIALSGINEIAIDDSAGADTIDVQGSIPVRLASGQELAALTVGASARIALTGATLRTETLSVADGGVLDLGTGTLKIGTADVRAIEALVKTARDGQIRWQGPGIGTTAATELTGIAVTELHAGGVAVKYTYHGDANVDGRVDADDYFRIDQNFLAQPPDPLYAQGDFNYDGVINADDYFPIDFAFLGQGLPLSGVEAFSTRAVIEEAKPRSSAVRRTWGEGLWDGKERLKRSAVRRGR